MRSRALFFSATALLVLGCSSTKDGTAASTKSDAAYQEDVIEGLHELFLGEIGTLLGASKDLGDALPAPADRGWDGAADAGAILASRGHWYTARSAYERIEGAIAPLFPDVDFAIDGRYDDFLAELGAAGDPDAFDGTGVTGMHAVERILFSDVTPARVVGFEETLPGYLPARFPGTSAEAAETKSGLVAQLSADVTTLRDQWTPVHIHPFIALQGLTALMNEQAEKVRKAASNEEESRYAQRTMTDIRDNLAGTRAAFALFEPWIQAKSGGADVVTDVHAGFDALGAAYDAVSGDAFPEPPVTWSSENPSAADLSTSFGVLFVAVTAAVDPKDPKSVVSRMEDGAALIGYAFPR